MSRRGKGWYGWRTSSAIHQIRSRRPPECRHHINTIRQVGYTRDSLVAHPRHPILIVVVPGVIVMRTI